MVLSKKRKKNSELNSKKSLLEIFEILGLFVNAINSDAII